jgi:hypothetical protein
MNWRSCGIWFLKGPLYLSIFLNFLEVFGIRNVSDIRFSWRLKQRVETWLLAGCAVCKWHVRRGQIEFRETSFIMFPFESPSSLVLMHSVGLEQYSPSTPVIETNRYCLVSEFIPPTPSPPTWLFWIELSELSPLIFLIYFLFNYAVSRSD